MLGSTSRCFPYAPTKTEANLEVANWCNANVVCKASDDDALPPMAARGRTSELGCRCAVAFFRNERERDNGEGAGLGERRFANDDDLVCTVTSHIGYDCLISLTATLNEVSTFVQTT